MEMVKRVIIRKDSLQRIKDKIQRGSDRQNKILPFFKPGTNSNLPGKLTNRLDKKLSNGTPIIM
jgi:hypothetical protein